MMKQENKHHSDHQVPQLAMSDFPAHSLTNSTYSATSRTAKFIPAEFKNKHLHDSPLKLPRTHKKSAELIPPFRKNHNFHAFDSQCSSQKSIQGKGSECVKAEKRLTPLLIESGFPKLRDTKSTQCQSPKAVCWMQPSQL
jgi:hypothetical protein